MIDIDLLKGLRDNITPGEWDVLDLRDVRKERLSIASSEHGGCIVCRITNSRICDEDEANANAIAMLPQILDYAIELAEKEG